MERDPERVYDAHEWLLSSDHATPDALLLRVLRYELLAGAVEMQTKESRTRLLGGDTRMADAYGVAAVRALKAIGAGVEELIGLANERTGQ